MDRPSLKRRPIRQTEEQKLQTLRDNATNGDVDAQFALAQRLEHGDKLVTKDEKAAVRWYLSAGMKNHIEALCRLAYMAENGIGTERSVSHAFTAYNEAINRAKTKPQRAVVEKYSEQLPRTIKYQPR